MTEKIENKQAQNKQRFFALCGIIAPILFALLVIVASFLRQDYSQIHNFISDLGVGPNAIIQNVNFVIFGIMVIVFSFGLRNGLPATKGRSMEAGIWLVIIFGLGILGAGIFPEDYLSQVPHNIVSSIAFLTIIAAQLLVWKGLKNADNSIWGKYRTYSLISGLLSIILLLVLRVTIGGDYQGIAQRIFLAVPWIWIFITGLKLYALTKKS